MQKKTLEQEFDDMREAEIQRLRNQDLERIRKVAADLPRYNALSLTERLLDRGDVMKAVPLAVVETMKEAAEVISFFTSHMQIYSPKMGGDHIYRFADNGWTWSQCKGPNSLAAVQNAIKAINAEKEKSRVYVHITSTETVDEQSGRESNGQ